MWLDSGLLAAGVKRQEKDEEYDIVKVNLFCGYSVFDHFFYIIGVCYTD
jgi:hypothetical protein